MDDDDDDFASGPALQRGASRERGDVGVKRKAPGSDGLHQNEATVRRICELARAHHSHAEISISLHEEGHLNSKGNRWARTTDGKVIARVCARHGIELCVASVPEAVIPAALRETNRPAQPRCAINVSDGGGAAEQPPCGDELDAFENGAARGTALSRQRLLGLAAARPPSASDPLRGAAGAPPACARAPAPAPAAPPRPAVSGSAAIVQPPQCPLCSEPFASHGRHQLCSLPCGHLYGRRCITAHLFRSKTCVLCEAPAKRAALRPLYATARAGAPGEGDVPGSEAARALAQELSGCEAACAQLELELTRLSREQAAVQQQVNAARAANLLGTGSVSVTAGDARAVGRPAAHGRGATPAGRWGC